MMTNVINVTSLCWSTLGIVLFIGYLRFAYSVTHRENVYEVQRWKTAIWFAGILCLVLLAVFLRPSIATILNNSSEKDTIDLIEFVIVVILSTLSYFIPILFVLTVGVSYMLKWWRNSDNSSGKIGKESEKDSKSPVQES